MGGLIRSSLGVLSPKINQRTTMKAVFALLLVCLIQISFAEEQESIDSEGNLSLEREARDAAETDCKGKKGKDLKRCRRRLRKQSRKMKNKRKTAKSQKGRKGRNGQRKAKLAEGKKPGGGKGQTK